MNLKKMVKSLSFILTDSRIYVPDGDIIEITQWTFWTARKPV